VERKNATEALRAHPSRSTFTAKDPVEMPEDMAFQEKADPPSENYAL